MKLLDIILFVLAICFFVVGIDQAIVVGIAESYWIFMFSLLALFLYGYRKGKNQDNKAKGTKNAKELKQKRKNG